MPQICTLLFPSLGGLGVVPCIALEAIIDLTIFYRALAGLGIVIFRKGVFMMDANETPSQKLAFFNLFLSIQYTYFIASFSFFANRLVYLSFTNLGRTDLILKCTLSYGGVILAVALTSAHILEYTLRTDMGPAHLFHYHYCMQVPHGCLFQIGFTPCTHPSGNLH